MPDIKQITLPSGTTYDLRDGRVDSLISQATKWVGVTTTVLSDGSTTNTIVINGDEHNAQTGDIASYDNMEFIWNGTVWQEFGSTGSLKALAFKDTASGSVSIPSTFSTTGTASAPTISVSSAGATDTITGITNVGSMPTFTVTNEVLTITAGATPTADTQKTFKTGDASYEASTSSISASTTVTGSTSTTVTVS